MLQSALQCSRSLACSRIIVLLVEQVPTRGRHDQPTCDLYHDETNAKEA